MLEEMPPVARSIGEGDGGEETAQVGETEAGPLEGALQMDVAVPPQVEVGRAFDLIVGRLLSFVDLWGAL